MSDKKSNLPDLNEISGMASKLFNDLRTSVSKIVDTYKKSRETEKPEEKPVDNDKKS